MAEAVWDPAVAGQGARRCGLGVRGGTGFWAGFLFFWWQIEGMELPNVTALAKANLYYDGKVVSHTVLLEGGQKKTLGVIFPGSYRFSTGAAETMEITDGECGVVLDGETEERVYRAGQSFEVAAESAFEIRVKGQPCQYICSYHPVG